MMSDVLRKSVGGAFITLVVTGLRFGIGFGSQLVLARLLLPEHFGVLAFSWMVVGFLNNLANLQTPKYLIATKENVERAVNTAFTLELLLSFGVFVATLVLAPWGMKVLGKPDQTTLVQVLALSYFFSPFLQLRALLERQLDFKRANIPDVSGVIAEAIIAIVLAYAGLGIWSLVLGRLSKFLVQMLIIWKITPYRPRLAWDTRVIKKVVNYGWPLIGSAILVFFYWNIDYYIVGWLTDDAQLGYYWMAFQISHYAKILRTAIGAIAFPAFSSLETASQLDDAFHRLSKYMAYCYLPLVVVAFVFGEPLIRHGLGEKWLPSLMPLRILMCAMALRAILDAWSPVFLSKGETRLLLSLTFLNAIALFTLGALFTYWAGIVGMSFAVLLAIIAVSPVAVLRLKRIISFDYGRILWRPLVVFTTSGFFGWLAMRISPLPLMWVYIISASSMGVGTYIAIKLFDPSMLVDLRKIIGTLVHSRQHTA